MFQRFRDATMFTISLVGQKGGTGKTTISVGLACAAARAGRTVAIIDLDPQATALKWKDRRSEKNPIVVAAQASRLQPALDTARAGGADYVVIDSAGRSDENATAAVESADMVLIPTRSSVVELETLPSVRRILLMAGALAKPAFIVLNCIHPSAGPGGIVGIRHMLEKQYGMKTCPPYLCQRSAYAEAMMFGASPQERDPDGKAGQELEGLFQFTNAELQPCIVAAMQA
jgi:chromosome partitioning protein